jgi:hypothetical protein
MNENIYEYDKASGHLFCKGCGNNYLLQTHKDDCTLVKPCVKYEVYMCHCLGDKVHLIGTYETREKAEKVRNETEDSMFDAWIKEKN